MKIFLCSCTNPNLSIRIFRKVSGLGDFLPIASHSYNVEDVHTRKTMLDTYLFLFFPSSVHWQQLVISVTESPAQRQKHISIPIVKMLMSPLFRRSDLYAFCLFALFEKHSDNCMIIASKCMIVRAVSKKESHNIINRQQHIVFFWKCTLIHL